ncbi:hypothetical protein ScPMuIL_009642 [Solemya velum]
MKPSVFMYCILCSVVAVPTCMSHVCLLSPPQRGSMVGINKPGAPDCGLKNATCGGRAAEASTVILRYRLCRNSIPAYFKPGQNFTVIIQKNLDHFNMSMPGNFNISLLDEKAMKYTRLGMIPDTSDPSLTLYSAIVKIPDGMAKQAYALQVVYNTMDPAPPLFYQCSDVTVATMEDTLQFVPLTRAKPLVV